MICNYCALCGSFIFTDMPIQGARYCYTCLSWEKDRRVAVFELNHWIGAPSIEAHEIDLSSLMATLDEIIKELDD